MRTSTLKRRLSIKENHLEKLYVAYEALLDGGVQSYAIGSRNLTKLNLPELYEEIRQLEKEVDALTCLTSGGAARRAIRVIPRDL